MKKTRHASPIILAVLCAVWVHTILFTDAGHRMQGAITETSVEVSDSHLVRNNDTISLVVQKDIPKVTQITASLVYNSEWITLSQPESAFGKITRENEDYSENILLIFNTETDIKKGIELAKWKITKVLPEIHTVNLTDVQVESSLGTINLSTKGTGEF